MSTTFALKKYAYLVNFEGKKSDWSLSQRTITSDQIALRMVIHPKTIYIYGGPCHKIETFSWTCHSPLCKLSARCNGKEMLFEAIYEATKTTRLVLVEFMESETPRAEFELSKRIPLTLVTEDFSHRLVGVSEVLQLLSEEVKKDIHQLVEKNMEEFLCDPTFPEYVQRVYQSMMIHTRAEE